MEKDFAFKLAAETGIDVLQVIREEAELIFLRGLFESSLSERIIFKGGTALRLLYGSPRFSEDLDFSVTKGVAAVEFGKVVRSIVASDSRFSIRDLASKYYTHLAEVRIKEPWRELAFSLKIEVSKRVAVKDETAIAAVLAKSNATNITVITRAYTLEQILKEKLSAIEERKMPRDIFDIWFVSQKLGLPFTLKKFGYPRGKIRQELRKFLPVRYYPVIDELEKLNAEGI